MTMTRSPARSPAARTFLAPLALLTALALSGCDVDPAPVFEIEGAGSIDGFLFLDADRSGVFDPFAGDTPLAGVPFEVRDRGTTRVFGAGSGVTGSDGRFAASGLPAGTHDLWIDPDGLPEGALLCRNPVPVSVYLSEAAETLVAAEPVCLITIQEAKEAGPGAFVNVSGIVTSFPGQLRGQYTYIQDGTAGVRVFSGLLEGQGIEVGDRLTLTAEVGLFNDDFQLTNPGLDNVEPGVGAPTPRTATTGVLAEAGPTPAAPLQGRLVVVRGARLVTLFTSGGNRNARIDDGSGPVEVRIEAGLSAAGDAINDRFTLNACYDMVGVVGNFRGTAQVFPRSFDDITEVACTGGAERE
jgi:DNA/RNA endonuclease YhcR with UshA esterase domain